MEGEIIADEVHSCGSGDASQAKENLYIEVTGSCMYHRHQNLICTLT